MQQLFELVIIEEFIANFADQTLAFIHTAETQHGNLHAGLYTYYKIYMTRDRSLPLIT